MPSVVRLLTVLSLALPVLVAARPLPFPNQLAAFSAGEPRAISHRFARPSSKKRQNLPGPDDVVTEAAVAVEDAASSDGGGVVVPFDGTSAKREMAADSAARRLSAKRDVEFRNGLAPGRAPTLNRAAKRQTNDIPAQLPTKGTAAGGITPFNKRAVQVFKWKRQTNDIPEQNPTKGSVANGIEPYSNAGKRRLTEADF